MSAGRIGQRLADVRHTVAADGVSVTVDIGGRLTGLELDDDALARGAGDLAARIHRLVWEATAGAARDGMLELTDAVAGVELSDPDGTDAAGEYSALRRWLRAADSSTVERETGARRSRASAERSDDGLGPLELL